MIDQVLVLNCGSSSIKFSLYQGGDLIPRIEGQIEAIGTDSSHLTYAVPGQGAVRLAVKADDYHQGLQCLSQMLASKGLLTTSEPLLAIGHRVVHGGARFRTAAIVDESVMAAIEACIPLAPLHNPRNLEGIRLAMKLWPGTPQVAVFDTAFHQTLPPRAFRYAVPEAWHRDFGIRRYGFHGISHAYVAQQAADHMGQPLTTLNLITLHLGNGASAAAIAGGSSIDTSMGFTPLEGLVMGTRPGDLDPGIVLDLLDRQRLPAKTLEQALNRESGLAGLCGHSDLRQIHAAIAKGDDRARLALELFCYRIKKYIGAYLAILGRVDALVFTAGIGENDPEVRARSCANLKALGIEIDAVRNQGGARSVMEIQSESSTIKVLVIPTNEALEIARTALSLITPGEQCHDTTSG